MRLSRFHILHYDEAPVHMFWRCHNKQNYLELNTTKDLYLQQVKESLEIQSSYKENLEINAFCVMDNHYHQLINYKNGAHNLSNFMRRCHGKFGLLFNRIFDHSGQVAESRPKTSLIENVEHTMRVHMYIEANPIRANKCSLKQLQFQKHCSYAFYAYGKINEFTQILKIPDWYFALGNTNEERQKKYRQLFELYLKEAQLTVFDLKSMFIGSQIWKSTEKSRIKSLLKLIRTIKNNYKVPE